jgi:hypothetical protein
MSDARRTAKPNQMRIQLTGGVGDLAAFSQLLKDYAADNGWALTLDEEPVRFGDVGPLHKQRIGFVEAR